MIPISQGPDLGTCRCYKEIVDELSTLVVPWASSGWRSTGDGYSPNMPQLSQVQAIVCRKKNCEYELLHHWMYSWILIDLG